MARPYHSAAARVLWLAEVANALDEAQRLTTHLARWRSDSREAVLLRVRIMAVRAEVDALQHASTGPLWSDRRALPRDFPRADHTP